MFDEINTDELESALIGFQSLRATFYTLFSLQENYCTLCVRRFNESVLAV